MVDSKPERPAAMPANHASMGTVRVGGMMGFAELVAELGGNSDRLLGHCGLSPDVLENADNIIPFNLGARLLHLAANETGCPHFGLLLGQRQNAALLGPVGFLMQHSPDVRTAIQNLIRYMHLHVQGASAQLSTERGLAQFSYNIHIRGVLGAEHVYNICMANKLNFMRLLCGEGWIPAAVHFCYREPESALPFQQLFNAPIRFNQPSSAMHFAAQDLERPVASADPNLRKVLQDYVGQIEARHSGDLRDQLRGVLSTLLPTGKCTVDRVAELFSMHRRTLHRRLLAYHVTFEEILDSVRREHAGQMLQQSDMPFSQLANMLGYRDISAFNRAFKRWYGTTPREWRSTQLQQPLH